MNIIEFDTVISLYKSDLKKYYQNGNVEDNIKIKNVCLKYKEKIIREKYKRLISFTEYIDTEYRTIYYNFHEKASVDDKIVAKCLILLFDDEVDHLIDINFSNGHTIKIENKAYINQDKYHKYDAKVIIFDPKLDISLKLYDELKSYTSEILYIRYDIILNSAKLELLDENSEYQLINYDHEDNEYLKNVNELKDNFLTEFDNIYQKKINFENVNLTLLNKLFNDFIQTKNVKKNDFLYDINKEFEKIDVFDENIFIYVLKNYYEEFKLDINDYELISRIKLKYPKSYLKNIKHFCSNEHEECDYHNGILRSKDKSCYEHEKFPPGNYEIKLVHQTEKCGKYLYSHDDIYDGYPQYANFYTCFIVIKE